MQFDHPELKLKYSVKDALTNRDVLRYDGAIATLRGAEMYTRMWTGALTLIDKWDAPIALDYDLDGAFNKDAIEIIKIVGLEVFRYRQKIDELPKN